MSTAAIFISSPSAHLLGTIKITKTTRQTHREIITNSFINIQIYPRVLCVIIQAEVVVSQDDAPLYFRYLSTVRIGYILKKRQFKDYNFNFVVSTRIYVKRLYNAHSLFYSICHTTFVVTYTLSAQSHNAEQPIESEY